MYTIGEFSKINRITPKTLRHYDKIGLLKPNKVDDWTGYRYYSAAQLPEIRHILMLRDMGFGLAEISVFLEEQTGLVRFLKKREDEINQSIEQESQRLKKVRDYLTKLKGEKMIEDIIIKELPAVMAASMRTVVPSYDTYFDIIPKMGEYMNSVGAVCREPAYCFTIYHDGEYRESDIDVEICEAVEAPCEESDKVKFRNIEGAASAACVHHKGPYSTMRETYNRLFAWIDQEGWRVTQPARESYIDGIWNKEDEVDWLTEIQVPVSRGED